MLYDLTLRDLSFAGTKLGVCLRLYGCREVQIGATMEDRDAFIGWMALAKTIGYQMIAAGRVRTIYAVEPEDYLASAFADVDSSELRSDDPMYRVANEYDTHQWMREAIRETLAQEGPRLARNRSKSASADLRELHRNMCALSLWLAMHDPEFGNAMRQRLLDCFRAFKQAVLTIACSEQLAYVRNIGPNVTDLTKALHYADNSIQSSTFD